MPAGRSINHPARLLLIIIFQNKTIESNLEGLSCASFALLLLFGAVPEEWSREQRAAALAAHQHRQAQAARSLSHSSSPPPPPPAQPAQASLQAQQTPPAGQPQGSAVHVQAQGHNSSSAQAPEQAGASGTGGLLLELIYFSLLALLVTLLVFALALAQHLRRKQANSEDNWEAAAAETDELGLELGAEAEQRQQLVAARWSDETRAGSAVCTCAIGAPRGPLRRRATHAAFARAEQLQLQQHPNAESIHYQGEADLSRFGPAAGLLPPVRQLVRGHQQQQQQQLETEAETGALDSGQVLPLVHCAYYRHSTANEHQELASPSRPKLNELGALDLARCLDGHFRLASGLALDVGASSSSSRRASDRLAVCRCDQLLGCVQPNGNSGGSSSSTTGGNCYYLRSGQPAPELYCTMPRLSLSSARATRPAARQQARRKKPPGAGGAGSGEFERKEEVRRNFLASLLLILFYPPRSRPSKTL